MVDILFKVVVSVSYFSKTVVYLILLVMYKSTVKRNVSKHLY